MKKNPYTPLQLQRARNSGRNSNWAGVNEGWTYLSMIISGVIVWGGIGLLLDAWLGTKPVFVLIGALLGNFAGIYGAYLRAFRPGSNEQQEDARAA